MARVIPLLAAITTLRAQTRPAPREGHSPLTRQEARILGFVAEGLTATQIGDALRISPLTVRKHLEHSYEKLGAHNRVQAVREAERLGILERARLVPQAAAQAAMEPAADVVEADDVDIDAMLAEPRLDGVESGNTRGVPHA
ncbi:LuxR family transcriptional regulator [Gryllotalpicola protaetiae]|uniref:LuxR family transcriptional regulator n=1 Tax=Gryllotalpicola protaetiae TaxID=2419771 RepID=A0A387BNT5_9MICO|nr:LuxR family transcriptional regulator [Gryllotalpicola protaetiae]